MADHTDYNCTLMGDIVIPSDITCSITLVVSGPTTYTQPVVLQQGDWFASALHLLQYLVDYWNDSIPGGQMSVTLVTDHEDAHFGKFAVVPETGLGSVTSLTVSIPSIYAQLGLSSAAHDFGSGSSTKYSGVVPYVLTPYWPAASMNYKIEVHQGVTERAEDGTVYSTAGVAQDGLSLGLTLDRYQGYSETLAWLSLWTERWSRGRSVVFYLDNSNLPTAWATTLSNAYSLVAAEQGSLDFTRLVEYSKAADYTKPSDFLVRKPRYGDTYNLPAYELR